MIAKIKELPVATKKGRARIGWSQGHQHELPNQAKTEWNRAGSWTQAPDPAGHSRSAWLCARNKKCCTGKMSAALLTSGSNHSIRPAAITNERKIKQAAENGKQWTHMEIEGKRQILAARTGLEQHWTRWWKISPDRRSLGQQENWQILVKPGAGNQQKLVRGQQDRDRKKWIQEQTAAGTEEHTTAAAKSRREAGRRTKNARANKKSE
jgi:hypothetical protein